RTKARISPIVPYELDESVRQVIDTLKEKSLENTSEVTGYSAKIFCELDDPPAPIEWLPVLEKEGLLSFTEDNGKCYPASPKDIFNNLQSPNKITLPLWIWLTKYLERDELLKWVMERGLSLHPALQIRIKWILQQDNKPKEPYLTFWRILVSDYLFCGKTDNVEVSLLIDEYKNSRDQLAFFALERFLVPKIKLRKSISWLTESLHEHIPGKIYDAEVVLALSNCNVSNLKKLGGYPKDFSHFITNATVLLKKAMDLWAYIGKADKKNDPSHWSYPSISPHPQNHRYHSWTFLIELCRDLWDATWEQNRGLAISSFQTWRLIDYPVFRRLVLYAMVSKPVLTVKESLEYLLLDDAWWLWSVETKREKFRLLANLWPKLEIDQAERLLKVVAKGPPHSMYSS
ncbi:MAG: hypothetical protein ACE5GN_00740, partial [Waddliaceae bacterium]